MCSIHSAYGLSLVFLESLRCFLFFLNWTLTGTKLRVQSESGHSSWHVVSKLDLLVLPMTPPPLLSDLLQYIFFSFIETSIHIYQCISFKYTM